MTLRPIKAKHSSIRRSRRYARLTSNHGHWGEFKPRNIFKPNGEFNPFFASRKGKATVIILILILGFFGSDQILKVAYGPTNSQPVCTVHADPSHINSNLFCIDPSSYLWHDDGAAGDLSAWNQQGSHNVFNSNCAALGLKCIKTRPDPGNSSVLISKVELPDLSIANGKTLQTFFEWSTGTLFGWPAGIENQNWGLFITTNNTAPTHAPGVGGRWNPFTDPSVVMVEDVYCSNNATTTCGNSVPNPGYTSFIRAKRDPLKTISQEDTGVICNGSTSCFINTGELKYNSGTAANSITYYLNYTSVTGPQACTFPNPAVLGPGCSWGANFQTIGPAGIGTGVQFQQGVPPFQLKGTHYYLGLFNNVDRCGITGCEIFFYYDTNPGAGCPSGTCFQFDIWNAGPGQPVFPNLGGGDFFGPLIKTLVNIGIYIINTILAFAAVLGPSLQLFVAAVEAFYVVLINIVGNLIWPGSNLGTAIANELGNFIAWMGDSQTGLVAAFANSTAIFGRFYDVLKVTFPWLPVALSIALNLTTLAINSITELLVLVSFSMTLIVGGFSFYLIFFYFIYTGDDSLGGALGFLETTQFLIFNLGLAWTARISNYGIDIITAIVGLIPKPFVQMVAHRIPRLPIIESNASFVNPSMDFAEARSGNAFVFALWAVGLDFLAWYESRNPALPGSIGALIPGAVNPLLALNGMLPFLNLIVIISWGACIAFIGTRALSLAGADLFEIPVPIGPGRKISSGPKGFRISRGSKHLQGRLEKQFGRNKRGESVIKGGKEGKKAQQEQRNEEKEKAERIQEERTNQED